MNTISTQATYPINDSYTMVFSPYFISIHSHGDQVLNLKDAYYCVQGRKKIIAILIFNMDAD